MRAHLDKRVELVHKILEFAVLKEGLKMRNIPQFLEKEGLPMSFEDSL